MFSQKKKKHTWLYVCLGLTAAILAVLFLIQSLADGQNAGRIEEAPENRAGSEARADREGESDNAVSAPLAVDEQDDSEKKSDKNQFFQSYYLLKHDKDSVKIFFSDETGNKVLLEETGIVYETLSTEDQRRFDDGIRVESRDELNRLIMDYES